MTDKVDAPEEVTYTLKSSDGVDFKVPKSTLDRFNTLRNMVESLGDLSITVDSVIPLPTITSDNLRLILELTKGPISPKLLDGSEEALKTLFSIAVDISYLECQELYDTVIKTIATKYIKGKTPEEIRTVFHIRNDFGDDVTQEDSKK